MPGLIEHGYRPGIRGYCTVCGTSHSHMTEVEPTQKPAPTEPPRPPLKGGPRSHTVVSVRTLRDVVNEWRTRDDLGHDARGLLDQIEALLPVRAGVSQ